MMLHCFKIPFLLLWLATESINDPSVVSSNSVIEKIRLLGGKVTYENDSPSAPVVGISFSGARRFSDAYMHLITHFPQLTSLDLSETSITDEGLKAVKNLKHLRVLNVNNTRITGACLAELVDSSLTTINIGNTCATNEALNSLQNFKNLESLDLTDIPLKDDDILKFVNFKQL